MNITFERHGGHIQILLKSLSLQNCGIVPPESSFSANFTDSILLLLIKKTYTHSIKVLLFRFYLMLSLGKAKVIIISFLIKVGKRIIGFLIFI